jgi:hypothetical protein
MKSNLEKNHIGNFLQISMYFELIKDSRKNDLNEIPLDKKYSIVIFKDGTMIWVICIH